MFYKLLVWFDKWLINLVYILKMLLVFVCLLFKGMSKKRLSKEVIVVFICGVIEWGEVRGGGWWWDLEF